MSILDSIKDDSKAKVTKLVEMSATIEKPAGLNTVELMKQCSNVHKIPSDETMKIAEDLYRQGYISYPRTETTSYSENFDFNEVIDMLAQNPDYDEFTESVKLNEDDFEPSKGASSGDHPPITPVGVLNKNDIDEDHYKIYDTVVKHFISSIMPDTIYKDKNTNFSVEKYSFLYLQREVISENPYTKTSYDLNSSDSKFNFTDFKFKCGDEFSIKDVNIETWCTGPPGKITEAEIISNMESKGIGTDASISQHIKNVQKRGYITRIGDNTRFHTTQFGSALAKGYDLIDPELIKPQVREFIETICDMIAKYKYEYNE